MKLAILAAVIGIGLSQSAHAEQCQQPVLADAANYKVAIAKRKTNFFGDQGNPTSAYILRGDEVVVVSQTDKMACVEFSNANSGGLGWLKLADLGPIQKQTLKPADWAGNFQRDNLGSFVELKAQPGGVLSAKGGAYWAASAELAKKWGPNIGELEGDGKIENGVVHIGTPEKDGTDCTVDLRLLSKHYIIVAKHTADDGSLSCWGHNVSFDGLYVRVKK